MDGLKTPLGIIFWAKISKFWFLFKNQRVVLLLAGCRHKKDSQQRLLDFRRNREILTYFKKIENNNCWFYMQKEQFLPKRVSVAIQRN